MFRRKRFRTLLSAAVAAGTILGTLVASQPANAAAGAWDFSWVQLMSRDRDCFDSPPSDWFYDGGLVRIAPCYDAGDPNQFGQRWIFNWDPAGQGFRIVLIPSNMCLDGDTGTPGQNGTRVQLWTCNQSDQQLWDLIPEPRVPSRVFAPVPDSAAVPFYLSNRFHSLRVHRSMVLDQVNNVGQRVQITEITGGVNEVWDGFEEQCAYAFHKHFNHLLHRCN